VRAEAGTEQEAGRGTLSISRMEFIKQRADFADMVTGLDAFAAICPRALSHPGLAYAVLISPAAIRLDNGGNGWAQSDP